MRNRVSLLAAAILAASTFFLASCSPAPEALEPTAGGYELTLIGLGDIHGQLEPFPARTDSDGDGVEETVSAGGIARIAALVRNIESERPDRVAVLFSGDGLSDLYFHTFGGRAIYGLMSEAGYEIACFGNHEFDKGPRVLATALRSADFDWLCTDLAVDGTPLEGA